MRRLAAVRSIVDSWLNLNFLEDCMMEYNAATLRGVSATIFQLSRQTYREYCKLIKYLNYVRQGTRSLTQKSLISATQRRSCGIVIY